MSTEKKIIFFKKKFDKQIKYLILLIMANINNTEKNQEAVVSFDPWANHSDEELNAMAEAYAERELARDINLDRLEECTYQDEPYRGACGY